MMKLSEAEDMGAQFAKTVGKPSLSELRAMPAQELLEASLKTPAATNGVVVDGWFLPQDIYTIYSQGKQNDLALITGVTNDEGGNIAGVGAQAQLEWAGWVTNTLATWTEWVKRIFGFARTR
jgi:para-nitrobenzyl esterase